MVIIRGGLMAAFLLAATQVNAAVDMAAGQALAKNSACLVCHSIDKKVVGPAFKDVAARYKSDKTAEAKLFDKVKKGGTGVWGKDVMPPNAHLKDDDIKTLVKWVLAQ